MNDDARLLAALGAKVKADAHAEDELMARLSANELTAAEREELDRRAALDPKLAQLVELYRPVDVSRVLATSAASRSAVPQRQSVLRRLLYATPLVAAAAALFLLPRPSIEPVPEYDIEVQRTVSQTRAPAPSGGLIRIAGAEPVFVLRPRSRMNRAMAAQLFVAAKPKLDGVAQWHAWPQELESAEGGSVRVVLKSIAALPPSGMLGICVFDPTRGRPDAQTFPTSERCVKFELDFVTESAP